MATPLDELKHSVRVYLLITRSPSPQLATFLLKVLDFVDDPDPARREAEIAKLSLHITVGTVFIVHKMMEHVMESTKDNSLRVQSDELLVAVAKTRQMDDPLAAKSLLLAQLAPAIRTLGGKAKVNLPSILDCDGKPL